MTSAIDILTEEITAAENMQELWREQIASELQLRKTAERNLVEARKQMEAAKDTAATAVAAKATAEAALTLVRADCDAAITVARAECDAAKVALKSSEDAEERSEQNCVAVEARVVAAEKRAADAEAKYAEAQIDLVMARKRLAQAVVVTPVPAAPAKSNEFRVIITGRNELREITELKVEGA